MMFLLANWKSILAVVATAALAFLLHTLDVNRLEAKERADLQAQSTADNKQCDKAKAITQGVSHDYEKQIGDLAAQLDRAKRMRPATCVVVSTPRTAARRNASTGVALPAQQNAGITSDALIDFAGEAEHYRLQLIACQSFITQTWKEQNQ